MRAANEVSFNALAAVELDPVRRHERLLDLRLAAAVIISPRIEVCEALLAGVKVPAVRLAPGWIAALDLTGNVTLDEQLALRVAGHGPLLGTT